ncbi:MAG: hypothetical protein ACE37F_24225 [Nannocystaceae bacterium]
MSNWATAADEWAMWTQQAATAPPCDALDAFDAEVARRLESAGFAANLEETAVTAAPTGQAEPSESDATLIRPTPSFDDIADDDDDEDDGDEFGDAEKTRVHTPEEALEVGLEAPESQLEVSLEAQPDPDPVDRTVISPTVPATPPSDAVDGLVLPSLTMRSEPAPSPPPENGTVVAEAPTAPPPSGETVIAPAPTSPPALSGTTLVPTEAPHADAGGGTEVAPVVTPARTGGTLPPIAADEAAPTPEAKTAEAGASSSGVFRAFDIHDDEEPEPPRAQQKVVIGAPPPLDADDTSELEPEELVEETIEPDEEIVAEDVPPPPKETAKPPPAPPRTGEVAIPVAEAPPEPRPEPAATPAPTPSPAAAPRARAGPRRRSPSTSPR